MYEITTTITAANDVVDTDTWVEDFATQEEALQFLTEFVSYEASRLYEELGKVGDRTFVAIDDVPHRAMRRSASGTTRRDGAKPLEGNVTITARRVA